MTDQVTENWGQIVMPVGKYQGYTIEVIPDFYIKWLAENWRGEEICKAADLELAYRKKWDISITEDPTGPRQQPQPRSRPQQESSPSEGSFRGTYPEDDDIPF